MPCGYHAITPCRFKLKSRSTSFCAPQAFLHQDIQHLAFLIYRAPEIDLFAIDLEEHFVEVPSITTAAAVTTKAACVLGTKLQRPEPNRFVRHFDAAFQHHFLHVAKTQAKAKVQPRAMSDDFGGETLTAVRGIGVHSAIASPAGQFDNTHRTIAGFS
jgi:hypothetical protein